MQSSGQQFKRSEEKVWAEEFVTVERKTFTMQLRENDRGRFVRVTEKVGDRFNTIIVPESGFEGFVGTFAKVAGGQG